MSTTAQRIIQNCLRIAWIGLFIVVAWNLWLLYSQSNNIEVQTVKVPVPVECREPVPARPAMPLEALRARQGPMDLDQFTQAAIAELARREGYEIKLLAALTACRKPVAQ